MQKSARARAAAVHAPDPATLLQLKAYEEALKYFQQQKFHRAKESLERVLEGPSKELADRATMHVRICEQRISRPPAPAVICGGPLHAGRGPDEPGPLGRSARAS